MYVYRGVIGDVARRAVQPEFVDACRARFRVLHGTAPGEEEAGSWQRSWPVLLDALVRAGLEDLDVLLELSLPGTGERVDAAVVGQDADGVLTVVVVELKQWTRAARSPRDSGMLEVGQRTVPHPARQVGGYVHYLRDWADGGRGVRVNGTVLLHNAPIDLITFLRDMAPPGEPSAEFPLLGRDDLAPGVPAGELARSLGCVGLAPAPTDAVDRFLSAEHRPSESVLERVAAAIENRRRFFLIGEQDRARLAILDAVREVSLDRPAAGRSRPAGLVVVTGGPGTGKTVIAARVMGDLCRMPGRNPRLLTPSGTLTRQLQRLLSEDARGLVATFKNKTPAGLDRNSVVLLDEAHRAATYPHQRGAGFPILLRNLLDRVGVLVLFLDERQIVRPTEGLTLDELERHAHESRATLRRVNLETQFRCNGSQAYHHWIDLLFSPADAPQPWNAASYDLALAPDPDALASWTDGHTAQGRSARITAGFCWPWNTGDVPPLAPEVAIRWHGPDHDERTWARPWNLRSDQPVPGFPDIPARPYWATDRGGHDQVGCIYTAQGLEYAFGAVILGADLVRRDGHWQAHPEASHDARQLRTLPPEQYLRYALNTYRVLATRATHGTRLYSTDPETQAYLASLLPGS
ncbi:ATP-binding protein [Kitasatospora xanthocidica]|uniref:DNA/RNA helicase domain-containing protein n=1 Tax=Kitasatospora xanthocidica TaxID=83382 RepID=UPI00167BF236|nr:DNA/RNA helicase domain-containing protein [Kitasatospora xanthocidica]GHF86980.1 ATP-binding protein [Kitasatospora xanthocidica]